MSHRDACIFITQTSRSTGHVDKTIGFAMELLGAPKGGRKSMIKGNESAGIGTGTDDESKEALKRSELHAMVQLDMRQTYIFVCDCAQKNPNFREVADFCS